MSSISENYSGSTADSLKIISITNDYDGDGYGGWETKQGNWGTSGSIPVTVGLDSSGNTSPFIGFCYRVDLTYDICGKYGPDNGDMAEITFKIKGENGLWGQEKKSYLLIYRWYE